MNFKITSAWGAVSAVATLIALFLWLNNSEDASRLFRSGGTQAIRFVTALQGRGTNASR